MSFLFKCCSSRQQTKERCMHATCYWERRKTRNGRGRYRILPLFAYKYNFFIVVKNTLYTEYKLQKCCTFTLTNYHKRSLSNSYSLSLSLSLINAALIVLHIFAKMGFFADFLFWSLIWVSSAAKLRWTGVWGAQRTVLRVHEPKKTERVVWPKPTIVV